MNTFGRLNCLSVLNLWKAWVEKTAPVHSLQRGIRQELLDVETKHAALVGDIFWTLCEVVFHWHPAAGAKGAIKGGFNPDVDYQPLHLLCSDSVRHKADQDGDGLCLY